MGQRDRFDGEFDAVLAAAQAGDPAGLERIYTALAPVVAGYVRLQGAAEPDDVTSEVFLGVMRNLHRFRGGEAKFRSWVFTIAHRRVLDERRSTMRRPDMEALPAAELAAVDDVEAAVHRSLEVERLRALCQHLVPDQRDVVLLRLLGQLTVGETAAALGKTPGAVKALQRRGFMAVERLLAKKRVVL